MFSRGYRRELPTFRQCFHSVLGYWHNESVNILSHYGGAILVFFLAIFTWPYILGKYDSVTVWDAFGFYVFLASAMICLSLSGTFHCVACHSEVVAKQWNKLDYAGIVILTVGSFFPSLYYGFFCDPFFYRLYLTSICMAGAFAAYIVLAPGYSSPAYRWARTSVFLGLGLCGVVPVIHGFFTIGFERMRHEMGVLWLVLSGAFYIVGALTYANRIPERWYPGRFDLFGASHQLFHFAVVAAVIAHYLGVLKAFEYHHGLRSGECVV